jgi:hypothetical protein
MESPMFPFPAGVVQVAIATFAAAAVLAATVEPVAQAATRLFTADYSTGNFLQWEDVENVNYPGGPASEYIPSYPARVVEDSVRGHCGRFEVRTGDVPAGMPTGERSQVGEYPYTTRTPAETTRWYAFSMKFDASFPTNHTELGWGITNEWKSGVMKGSPTVMWGWAPGGGPDGYWSLFWNPQSSPGVFVGRNVRLVDVPMNPGKWIDVKMQVRWSPSDANGYLNVWVNGARQTFLAEAGGGQTFTGRTMIPGDTGLVHYTEGYYRQNGIAPTGIVYTAGFRMADSQDSL